jgi:class 3 adenylate cyclase
MNVTRGSLRPNGPGGKAVAEDLAVATEFRGELEGLLSGLRLRFPPGIERAFRADYAERWRSTNRTAFAVGLATFAGFGIVDLLATTRSLGEVWVLRFALGVPPAVAILLLSYTSAFARLMQPMTAAVVFVFGALIVGMEIVIDPDELGYHLYLFGIAPVTAFGYAAPRLRFWNAVATGWAIWLATLAVGFDHGVWSTRAAAIEFSVILALLAAVNIAGMIGAYLMEAGSRRGFLQELIMQRERERSDRLLQNILPGSVAERLKRGEEEVAEAYEEATVMFADLVGFTPFAETLDPHELMLLLNSFFSRFDALAETCGLEKIKTIGDCYMAVGGVPVPQPNHAERAADMALCLQEEVKVLGRENGCPFKLRVGIDTGPLVAGVIGTKKFSYDLWGDTVNTASRMQTHAAPGAIMVTASTFRRLRHGYLFEGPEMVAVKGKGDLPTYRLLGRIAPPVSANVSSHPAASIPVEQAEDGDGQWVLAAWPPTGSSPWTTRSGGT